MITVFYRYPRDIPLTSSKYVSKLFLSTTVRVVIILVFLGLLALLEASADRVFAENSFETDREKEVRFSAAAQLGVRCDEVAAEAAREA